jgi:uncharacterized membrane protein SpoIIM required for sporulation
MSEHEFVEQNGKDWYRLNDLLDNDNADANELNELFVKVSGDLSYAQTYFPKRRVRIHLNSLVIRVFDRLHTRKRQGLLSSLLKYYKDTLPRLIAKHRYAFVSSFFIFFIAFVIGSFSTLQNHEFPRVVLGDEYIDLTEANIKKGDAFNIYKREDSSIMFLGITFNNIRVAFVTFVFGLFTAVGSALILFYNGVMLGAFMTFFYIKGLARDAILTVWIHGTLEISIIIIAGAAGIIMGHSLVKPKSLYRLDSLSQGAKAGMWILISTVPVFVMAAFLESFVTRLTGLPDLVKASIIIASALFISIFYFYKPMIYRLRNPRSVEDDVLEDFHNTDVIKTESSSPMKYAFIHYRHIFGDYLGYVFLPISALCIIFYYFSIFYLVEESYGDLGIINPLMKDSYKYLLFIFYITAIYYFFLFILTVKLHNTFSLKLALKTGTTHFLALMVSTLFFATTIYFASWWSILICILVPYSIAPLMVESVDPNLSNISTCLDVIKTHYKIWSRIIMTNISLIGFLIITHYVLTSTLGALLGEVLDMSQIIDNANLRIFFIGSVFNMIILMLTLPVVYYLIKYKWEALLNEDTSQDLMPQLEKFLTKNEVY